MSVCTLVVHPQAQGLTFFSSSFARSVDSTSLLTCSKRASWVALSSSICFSWTLLRAASCCFTLVVHSFDCSQYACTQGVRHHATRAVVTPRRLLTVSERPL